MLTKEQFAALSATDQNYEIYSRLPQRTAEAGEQGASSIEGLFGPSRPKTNPPVRPKRATPKGFVALFGPEPDSRGTDLTVWLQHLAKFETLIDLTDDIGYFYKAALARQHRLGEPIAFAYNGEQYLAFENRPRWWASYDTWRTDYEGVVTRAANIP